MRKIQQRLLKYKEKKLRYFSERKFSDSAYEEKVLSSMPNEEQFLIEQKNISYGNIPVEMRVLYQYPLLSREQEYHLFRKFNYCKYRASRMLRKLNPGNVTTAALAKVEAWLRCAKSVKHLLVSCNTRLVCNWAKKQSEYAQNPNLDLLLAIISDGSVGLTRAVDYFNFTMGLKFSTYATWAIRDTICKGREQRNKHVDRQTTGCEEVLNKAEDHRPAPPIDFSDQDYLVKLVTKLEPRKQEVIQRYYGLLEDVPAENLEMISVRMKLSKERVRQIKEESLADLRVFAGVN